MFPREGGISVSQTSLVMSIVAQVSDVAHWPLVIFLIALRILFLGSRGRDFNLR